MFFSAFMDILDKSIVASFVILIVLLARRLLAPRFDARIWFPLWGVVLLRLLMPVTSSLGISLIPARLFSLPQNAALPLSGQVSFSAAALSAYHAVGDTLNGGIDRIYVPLENTAGMEFASATHGQVWLIFFSYLWPLGMAALWLYALCSLFKLKKSLSCSVHLKENIYLTDGISSPFVLGLRRPRIYLPSSLSPRESELVLRHEQCHIRRRDHIFKFLAFAALALHWFNPLVWLAFSKACADMETACDETVLLEGDTNTRADYAAALLHLSTGRRAAVGVPLAFGEGDVSRRIRHILAEKRHQAGRFIVLLLTLLTFLLIFNPARRPLKVYTPDPVLQNEKEQAWFQRIEDGDGLYVAYTGSDYLVYYDHGRDHYSYFEIEAYYNDRQDILCVDVIEKDAVSESYISTTVLARIDCHKFGSRVQATLNGEEIPYYYFADDPSAPPPETEAPLEDEAETPLNDPLFDYQQ